MMPRALAEAGIQGAGTHLAVFERGRRQAPVVGKLISVARVDEISDRQYLMVDGADGRVHYADLGRLHRCKASPRHDRIAERGQSVRAPKVAPRLKIQSIVALEARPAYDGPTWLDTALSAKQASLPAASSFAGKLEAALAQRRRWLVDQRLAERGKPGNGRQSPKCDMRCNSASGFAWRRFTTRAERGTRALRYRISADRGLPTGHCDADG